jgi:hypothetical protein
MSQASYFHIRSVFWCVSCGKSGLFLPLRGSSISVTRIQSESPDRPHRNFFRSNCIISALGTQGSFIFALVYSCPVQKHNVRCGRVIFFDFLFSIYVFSYCSSSYLYFSDSLSYEHNGSLDGRTDRHTNRHLIFKVGFGLWRQRCYSQRLSILRSLVAMDAEGTIKLVVSSDGEGESHSSWMEDNRGIRFMRYKRFRQLLPQDALFPFETVIYLSNWSLHHI